MVGSEFERELRALLNKHNQESGSDTPDFILARYLTGCLRLFDNNIARERASWYGRHDGPSTFYLRGMTNEEVKVMSDGTQHRDNG